jgi:hypothetical protein
MSCRPTAVLHETYTSWTELPPRTNPRS